MKRIERIELFLQAAELFSKRGACQRLQTGAVIVKDNRIVSTGYNGSPSGTSECKDTICDLSKPCIRAIHAEANAIYFAARNGISLEGSTIYCTHAPCIKCAEAIIQSGIKRVYFRNEFRNLDGLNLLVRVGINSILYNEDTI